MERETTRNQFWVSDEVSHFRLLLNSLWTKFNKTWHKAPLFGKVYKLLKQRINERVKLEVFKILRKNNCTRNVNIFKNVCTYRDVRYKNCSIGDPKTNTEVPKRVKKINLQIFKENGFKNYNTTVTCAVIMVHIV